MNLREATDDDLNALDAVEQAAHPDGWSRAQLQDELAHNDGVTFVVDDGDDAVAFLCARRIAFEWWVMEVATLPHHRRRGAARLLLQAAKARAVDDALPLWLEVRASNTGAIQLYRSEGFVEHGRRRGYYPGVDGGPREDALQMAWTSD